jgi:5-methylcytosine-specific restriction endonuclease McrA
MHSNRYGDLMTIAHKTDCRCHLCHEPVDILTYGLVKIFGGDTASVDHLDPQALGGTDDEDNLMIAHQRCNSSRGMRDVEETRLALAGTTDEPWSKSTWDFATLGVSLPTAFVAGKFFATTNDKGEEEFNTGAALLTFFATLGLMSAAREA